MSRNNPYFINFLRNIPSYINIEKFTCHQRGPLTFNWWQCHREYSSYQSIKYVWNNAFSIAKSSRGLWFNTQSEIYNSKSALPCCFHWYTICGRSAVRAHYEAYQASQTPPLHLCCQQTTCQRAANGGQSWITPCGLVKPYGDIDLSQHWPR